VPWVPVVVLGSVSGVVALLVALRHAWEVLVAVGAALEAMIYGVALAGFCTVPLRALSRPAAPVRVRGPAVLGPVGMALFGVLAVLASVFVQARFNPIPLVIILVAGALSGFYVLRVLPGVQAREAARRSARRRPRPVP
jgi:basic amino acid/polyamine antiporter, APA family